MPCALVVVVVVVLDACCSCHGLVSMPCARSLSLSLVPSARDAAGLLEASAEAVVLAAHVR